MARRGTPSFTRIIGVFVGFILIAGIPYPAYGSEAVAQGSSPSSIVLLNQTLFLNGNDVVTAMNYSYQIPSNTVSGRVTYLVSVQTPEADLTGPGNISLSLLGAVDQWRWPYTLGVATLPLLDVAGGTNSESIALPPALITGGRAVLASDRGNLTGNYSLSLYAGGSLLVERSGVTGYGKMTPVAWAGVSGSVSSASGYSNPDGTSTLMLGDTNGSFSIVQVTPGGTGVTTLAKTLSAPDPIVSITTPDMMKNGTHDVLLVGGEEVALLVPESSGGWGTVIVYYPDTILTGAVSAEAGYREPWIIASDGKGELLYSRWLGQTLTSGWTNPLQILASLSGPVTVLRSTQLANGTSLIGAAVGQTVHLFTLSNDSFDALANVTLPSGVSVNDLALRTGDGSMLIAASDGHLYSAVPPSWTASAVPAIVPVSPLLGVAMDTSGSLATVNSANNTVQLLENPLSGSPEERFLGSVTGLAGGAASGFLPLFSESEIDPYVGGGTSLWASVNESTFNSTFVGSWVPSITSYLSQSTPRADAYGNPMVSVPVSLSVTGGGAHFSGAYVDYNYTRSISLTGPEISRVPKEVTVNTSLDVKSLTPGFLHLAIVAELPAVSPPPPISIWQGTVSWFDHYGIYLAIPLVLAGILFLSLGSARYWRRIHLPRGRVKITGPRQG